MSIDVKLSVIGFFSEILNQPVTINSPKPTVKDALDGFATTSSEVFTYSAIPSPFIKEGTDPGSRRHLVFSISFKGHKLDSILSSVMGSEERVWQFYVQDAKGINRGNSDRQPFDQYPLQEGDTVIWRLVTVFHSTSPKRVKMGTVSPVSLANQGKTPQELVETVSY